MNWKEQHDKKKGREEFVETDRKMKKEKRVKEM